MHRNINAVKLMNAILAGERDTFQQCQRNIIRDMTRKTRYNTIKMDNKFAVSYAMVVGHALNREHTKDSRYVKGSGSAESFKAGDSSVCEE